MASLRKQAAYEGSWARDLGFRKSNLITLAAELERRGSSNSSDGNPACPTEKRAYRRQMLGVEQLLLEEAGDEGLSTFTLLNSSWRVPADPLMEFEPGSLIISAVQDDSGGRWYQCGHAEARI